MALADYANLPCAGRLNLARKPFLSHVILDSPVPSLPGSEIDVEFPQGLRLIRGRWDVHLKRKGTSLLSHAAGPLQKVLQHGKHRSWI
jgi:hypothetical protein